MKSEAQTKHLHKYIAEQDLATYSPVEQATWRFIMRLLKNFLKESAHPFYEEGLEKAGIEVDKIPSIEEMRESLEKHGWKTVPVSGFLPPTAFLEMQSLGYLPIAKEIRSVDHIPYTPAPDIVHEAAGHAPFLAHPDFTNYLHKYADIANKSIISSEDITLYRAIRKLSDVKEHPDSTREEINQAQKELEQAVEQITYVSEASRVSRLYWWTAEYGLVGSLEDPKLYGAGLLSSIGEARECLSDKIKKIPLSMECIEYDFDITEPQPQLFVVKDFKALDPVLEELANTFSFRKGGEFGLKEAIRSKIVNSIELDSGLQISGIVETYKKDDKDRLVFVKTTGPSQLSYQNMQLEGHDKEYHEHGYSTIVDVLEDGSELSKLSNEELNKKGIKTGESIEIRFQSGIELKGKVKNILNKEGKNLIISFEDCSVKWGDEVLFQPDWGVFDLGLGSSIPSVFGGPADSEAFGDVEDFDAVIIPRKPPGEKEKKVYEFFQTIRNVRESFLKKQDHEELKTALMELYPALKKSFDDQWLAKMEIYELSLATGLVLDMQKELKEDLEQKAKEDPNLKEHIHDGLVLADSLKI